MSQTATRVYLGKKDAFPGWWVVGGCFTILFFSSALGFYGMSVYLNAFSKELGWKISSLSIATTFFFLVGGITNMLVARLIAKFDVRILIYAGAIVGGADDTAEAKKRIMRENGIHVVDSPAEIGKKVKEVLG